MSDANLPEHDLVKIHGLKARSDLNGLFARIVNKEPCNGRIVIEVRSTDERVLIKSENVTPITSEWIDGEEGHPYSVKHGTESWYKSVDGARRCDPGAECYIVTLSNGKKFETWTSQWVGPRDGPKSAKRKVASIKFFTGDHDFSDDDDDEVDYRTPKFEDDDNDNVDYRTPKFEEAGDDSVVYRSVPIP